MTPEIQPYKTKLNHGNAYWMARLSDVAYNGKDKPDEKGILKELKAEDSRFMDVVPSFKDNAQAILVEHEEYFCMAFRGTDEIRDWFDNFDFDKVEKHGCEFHEGFYRQVSKVWTNLEAEHKLRKKNRKNPRPMFFTGHSLGGAMATIATAIWVLEDDRQFTSTYTFGQPRAVTSGTDQTLNSLVGKKFFRFHHNNDFVPRVPLRVQDFRHVGQYIYINRDGEIHDEPGFWTRFTDQARGVLDARGEAGIDFFKDHERIHYVNAARKWSIN